MKMELLPLGFSPNPHPTIGFLMCYNPNVKNCEKDIQKSPDKKPMLLHSHIYLKTRIRKVPCWLDYCKLKRLFYFSKTILLSCWTSNPKNSFSSYWTGPQRKRWILRPGRYRRLQLNQILYIELWFPNVAYSEFRGVS